jgi:hypothetical protein
MGKEYGRKEIKVKGKEGLRYEINHSPLNFSGLLH